MYTYIMHDKLAEQYIIGFYSFPFLFYKLKNKALHTEISIS